MEEECTEEEEEEEECAEELAIPVMKVTRKLHEDFFLSIMLTSTWVSGRGLLPPLPLLPLLTTLGCISGMPAPPPPQSSSFLLIIVAIFDGCVCVCWVLGVGCECDKLIRKNEQSVGGIRKR